MTKKQLTTSMVRDSLMRHFFCLASLEKVPQGLQQMELSPEEMRAYIVNKEGLPVDPHVLDFLMEIVHLAGLHFHRVKQGSLDVWILAPVRGAGRPPGTKKKTSPEKSQAKEKKKKEGKEGDPAPETVWKACAACEAETLHQVVGETAFCLQCKER